MKNESLQELQQTFDCSTLLVYLSSGVSDCDQQRRYHLSDAGGLEERGPKQHHQADTLHHGGLAGGAQAAYYAL